MLEVYIDKFRLKEEEIKGFESFSIEKGIDEQYFGYWNNDGIGVATGESDLKVEVTNKAISDYIKRKFEKGGFNTKIQGRVIDTSNNKTFEMLIDFGTYEEVGCCNVSFSFRSKGSGDTIRAREKVEYGLQLTTDIQVPLRDLPTVINFEGVDGSYAGTGSLNHFIPLSVTENTLEVGTGSNVALSSTTPFFTSSSASCITITGNVGFTALSNTVGTFGVYLNNTLIDTYAINSAVTAQTVAINTSINLNPNQAITLEIRSTLDSTYNFNYSKSLTVLNISKCASSPIEYKTVKAISVREAFRQILLNSGQATLSKYIFDDCIFDGYLTNNKGLIGESSIINVSLFKLFEELNNKYPSSLSIYGSSAVLISRCEFLTCDKPYKIRAIDASRQINEDILFSSVKVGYNNWKPDNKFGGIEHNGKREYESDYSISSKTLSILNDWSGSSSIISEQIKKEKSTEEIHWITVNKATLRAETNEYISSDLGQGDRLINLRITPARNAKRWAKFIANDLRFTTGEGNYNFTSTDTYDCGCHEGTGFVDENANIPSESIFDFFKYSFTLKKCLVDLNRLVGCVQFEYCGKSKKGFVSSVKYGTDSSEDVEVEVIGFR